MINYNSFSNLYSDKKSSSKRAPTVDRNLVNQILKVNEHIFGSDPQININNNSTTPEQMYEEMCRKEEERKKAEKDAERKPKLPKEYIIYLNDLNDCGVNPKIILDLGPDNNFKEEVLIVWPKSQIIRDDQLYDETTDFDLVRINLGSYSLDALEFIKTKHLIVEMFNLNVDENIKYLNSLGLKCIGRNLVSIGSYGVYTFIKKSKKVKVVQM